MITGRVYGNPNKYRCTLYNQWEETSITAYGRYPKQAYQRATKYAEHWNPAVNFQHLYDTIKIRGSRWLTISVDQRLGYIVELSVPSRY